MPATLLALLVLIVAFSVRADATAFAGVEKAFWQADFAYYYDPVTDSRLFSLPVGVVMRCTGGASADGSSGCTDSRGTQVSSTGVLKVSVVDVLGGYELYNGTDTDYGGMFVFATSFSSFNPGGPEIGASVDNPAKEFASFFTVVQGPGAFDLHGCDMHHNAPAHMAPHSCGVVSPDTSFGEAMLGPLVAGGAASAGYRIYIRVTAQGADPVPEPGTLALLSAGLGLLMFRRRKA